MNKYIDSTQHNNVDSRKRTSDKIEVVYTYVRGSTFERILCGRMGIVLRRKKHASEMAFFSYKQPPIRRSPIFVQQSEKHLSQGLQNALILLEEHIEWNVYFWWNATLMITSNLSMFSLILFPSWWIEYWIRGYFLQLEEWLHSKNGFVPYFAARSLTMRTTL